MDKNYNELVTSFNSLKTIMEGVYKQSLNEVTRVNKVLNQSPSKLDMFKMSISETPKGYDEYNNQILKNHKELLDKIRELIISLLKKIEELKKTNSEKIEELNEMEKICLKYSSEVK